MGDPEHRDRDRRAGGLGALRVRPLEVEDLPRAAAVSGAAFGIDLSTPADRARWLERIGHALTTDPHGCFVAEGDGAIVGAAQALIREGLWVLSLLAVDPHGQSAGAGRALMQRVLDYGSRDAPGLIVSSNDRRALRLYALSGFSLLPTLEAHGEIERSALPAGIGAVSVDRDPDFEALAAVSRTIRGAPHTTELQYALRRGGRLVHAGDRGFAVVLPGGGVWLLVARDEDAAASLLWNALALVEPGEPTRVRWIGARNDWAISIVLRAGLHLSAYGALCVRGAVGPLRPFLPSAPFA